jgi:hypothetical protein
MPLRGKRPANHKVGRPVVLKDIRLGFGGDSKTVGTETHGDLPDRLRHSLDKGRQRRYLWPDHVKKPEPPSCLLKTQDDVEVFGIVQRAAPLVEAKYRLLISDSDYL